MQGSRVIIKSTEEEENSVILRDYYAKAEKLKKLMLNQSIIG